MRRPINIVFICAVLVIAAFGMWRCWFGSSKPKPNQVTVCIDPGHPSETNSGRTLQNGTTEAEINWQVACKLETLLLKDERIRVVKTRRTSDEFVRNRKRALIANDEKASLAVHLHCDAGPSRGFTIYYPDRQGKSGDKIGPAKSVQTTSKSAAETMQIAMVGTLGGVLRDRGVKGESFTRIGRMRGALTTSIWSTIPTITIEMVFLSNSQDAEFIKSENGQWQMAEAISEGIKDYIKPQLDALDK